MTYIDRAIQDVLKKIEPTKLVAITGTRRVRKNYKKNIFLSWKR